MDFIGGIIYISPDTGSQLDYKNATNTNKIKQASYGIL